ncbi:MAG: MiaB/RimO family radical SAM methylthiotransferase [Methanomicrobiales archaeon]|nr:MiaB/RimO family radical SAM methylthiotransferase [Methanomicrobiales archaeon]
MVTERDHSGQFRDLSGKKVAILTFGCTFNQGDTRILEQILTDLGVIMVSSPDEADAVVVNTCTVVGATERKMLRVLQTLREKPLYVTGCMAVVQRDEILSVCNPVFLTPPSRAGTCPGSSTARRYDVGIVQLGSGCPGSCTYCITRLARGPLKSYPGNVILEEIRAAVRSGTAEVRLTSQDCSSWGQDTGESLPALINRMEKIPGSFRVRLGMMNPATVLPLLDPLSESFGNRNLFRFAHIPVQSGSDRILRKMGRKYTADDVIGIVRAFRRRNPDITIATDIIVGFPGEEEEDVQATLDLLGRMIPAKINITRYSPRPGTPAAALKAPVDRVKKERSRLVQRHAVGIYRQLNRPLIGSSHPVLVTERIKPGTVLTRTDTYTGIVLHQDLKIGSELTARITGDRTYFFVGEPSG